MKILFVVIVFSGAFLSSHAQGIFGASQGSRPLGFLVDGLGFSEPGNPLRSGGGTKLKSNAGVKGFKSADWGKVEKPAKVKEVKTVELRRIAYQKWEKHDEGVTMLGNYMKVTYQTFYSNGTSKIWEQSYRS